MTGKGGSSEKNQGRSSSSTFCLSHLLLDIHSKGGTEHRVEIILDFSWQSFFFFNLKFTLNELAFYFLSNEFPDF